jgi:hypothetical protein
VFLSRIVLYNHRSVHRCCVTENTGIVLPLVLRIVLKIRGLGNKISSPVIRNAEFKFQKRWCRRQRPLGFTVIWLEAFTQKKHRCGTSTWWPTWKICLARNSKELPAFLWKRHLCAADILRQLVEIYDNDAISRQHLAIWCRTFTSGRVNVTDDRRNRNQVPRRQMSTLQASRNSFRRTEV